MKLLAFETRRAAHASVGWFGIIGIGVSALVFWVLLSAGARFTRAADPDSAIGIIGFLSAGGAAMSAAERNRGALVEDIWWALEPRAGLQMLQIYIAWAIIGFLQGGFIALLVGVAMGATGAAWAGFAMGYAAGLPTGLLQSALARRTRGATLFVGLSMMAVLFFSGPIATPLGDAVEVSRASQGVVAAAYLALTMAGTWALTRGMMRA